MSCQAGPDASLVVREHLAAGREEEARHALVESTRDSVYRFLLWMLRDEILAEDLFQETYLRAFRGLPAFRGESSLATWILTISRNLALNRLRRERNETVRRVAMDDLPELSDPAGPAGGEDLETAARGALADRHLLSALDCLTPAQREAVLLYYLEDRGVDEVARITGRPVNTIKSDLRRARQTLRECLEARGLTGNE